MEELSRIGAAKIAALDVTERAKRALLAETIEDRIFDLTEQLEQLVGVTGGVVDENIIDLAKQTKSLQLQYKELVSGEPSSLLQSLEDLGKQK